MPNQSESVPVGVGVKVVGVRVVDVGCWGLAKARGVSVSESREALIMVSVHVQIQAVLARCSNMISLSTIKSMSYSRSHKPRLTHRVLVNTAFVASLASPQLFEDNV